MPGRDTEKHDGKRSFQEFSKLSDEISENGCDNMADRETVITHLQIIHTWAEFARERDLNFFTAKHLEDIAQWADDALNLLKEQEAVEPYQHDAVWLCGNCEKEVVGWDDDIDGKENRYPFCRQCGKAVKWE